MPHIIQVILYDSYGVRHDVIKLHVAVSVAVLMTAKLTLLHAKQNRHAALRVMRHIARKAACCTNTPPRASRSLTSARLRHHR